MSLDRKPPHSADAEMSALNFLLSRGRMPPEFEMVTAGDFYDPGYGDIWAVALGLLRQGHACDAVAVNAALTNAGKHASGPSSAGRGDRDVDG